MANYTRPDATFPAIAEHGGRVDMSPTEVGHGWATDTQTRPPAARFNSRDYLTSSAVKYLCRLGVAEYSATETYQGLGMCIGSDESVYWNLTPCTGVDPVGDQAGYWEKMPCRRRDAEELIRYIVGDFLTRSQADLLYLSIADAQAYYATMNWVGDYIGQRLAPYASIDWVMTHFAQISWVEQRLANYATNEHAQNLANAAQNNAIGHSDHHRGLLQTYLQDYARNHAEAARVSAVNESVTHTNNVQGYLDNRINDLYARLDALMPTGTIDMGAFNGWTRLPNGLIIQWGQGYEQGTGNNIGQTMYFPVPFPYMCMQCVVGNSSTAPTDGKPQTWVITGRNNVLVNVRQLRGDGQGRIYTTPNFIAVGI